MAIIHIICFVMIALTAGYLLRVSLGDMLPFVWCGLIFILYFLAFSQNLSLIDIVLPFAAAVLGVAVWRKNKSAGNSFPGYLKDNLYSAPIWIYFILLVIVVIGVSAKTVTWWDDINYWASDAKSLYFLNGFANKYANVSPEFGDYPPGTQLVKWFALHMSGDGYKENLAFAGYYMFNMAFLMPLFGRIRKKSLWLLPLLAVTCWLFPGMADKYGYAGFCADLSMAFVFGTMLISSFDHTDEGISVFEALRIGLLSGVLVICKSTGAIWAFIGLVIWILVRVCGCEKKAKERVRYIIYSLICPAVIGGSWLAFCVLRRRVTKTTSTMITYLTTDDYGISDYTSEFAKAFTKAFMTEPLHVDKTWIAPSPVVMLILIVILLVLLAKKEYIKGRAGRIICIILPVVGVLYYGFIFVGHITIFAMETQYLESSAMIASIERYGLPFMLGSLLLIAWLWLNADKEVDVDDRIVLLKSIVLIMAVTALANIPQAYYGLIGYRTELEKDYSDKAEMIDEASETFLECISQKLPNGNARVCRLRDGGYYRVADTYVAYEASPVSVMTASANLDEIDEGTLISLVAQTHATYFYADKQDAENSYLNEMAQDGDFCYQNLYYIGFEEGTMKLYKQ